MRSIRGVKYHVTLDGIPTMLVYKGPENVRVFQDGENVTRKYKERKEELHKLADANGHRCNLIVR